MKESIYYQEYLSKFEDKNAKALALESGTFAEPIYTKNIKKSLLLPCSFMTRILMDGILYCTFSLWSAKIKRI
jgi:hypothetical protein